MITITLATSSTADTACCAASSTHVNITREWTRVLDLAQKGVTDRIAALERYAAQVRVADNAYHDYQHALELTALNDEHLELLTRTTVADKQAIAEISDLGRQAVVTRQALLDSLNQANEAAGILTLPTRRDTGGSS